MNTAIPIESPQQAGAVRLPHVGVLLVNLGTPDTADAAGVRVYLKEFLSDPRVIENQGLIWKLILNGIILRRRPGIKALDYRKIWNKERDKSPLKTITRAQAEKLARGVAGHDHVEVDWAMRYGNPSIKAGIASLVKRGCERILVVPLYPQYSAATSATVCDEVFRVLASMRAQPTLRVTPPYYDTPDYIEAIGSSIEFASGDALFQAGIDRGVVSRHAEGICRQGRSVSGAVHRDSGRSSRAAWTRCFKAPAHLPVALWQCRMAAALHRQDDRAIGKGWRQAHRRGHAWLCG